MNILPIARIVADIALFFGRSDDDVLDPDVANQMSELLVKNLKALDSRFLRELIDAFAAIAPEYDGGAQDMVRNLARSFFLEEALGIGDQPDGNVTLQIARIIADFVVFLELSDDEILDPDMAVKMMEGLDLEVLDKPLLRELIDAFDAIAPEYNGEAQHVVRSIAHGFYLEEALAADDPVKLAELEARRDAEQL